MDIRILTRYLVLETLVGTAPKYQKLELIDQELETKTELKDDQGRLNELGFKNHQILHVIDEDPASYVASTQQGDVVTPYVLSPEKEAARADAMRQAKEKKAISDDSRSLRVQVGDPCQVINGSDPSEAPRIGEVAFIGSVHWANGLWVGVKFSSALGKNDGSVKGTRYFSCEPNHGSFVKPSFVLPINDTHDHHHH